MLFLIKIFTLKKTKQKIYRVVNFKQVPRLSTSLLDNSQIIQVKKAWTPKTQSKQQKELITELTGKAIKASTWIEYYRVSGAVEPAGHSKEIPTAKTDKRRQTKPLDHAASTSGSSYKSLSWSSSAIRYWISSQSDESSIARSSLSICRSRSKDIWQETGKAIKPNSEGDATPKAKIKKKQRIWPKARPPTQTNHKLLY